MARMTTGVDQGYCDACRRGTEATKVAWLICGRGSAAGVDYLELCAKHARALAAKLIAHADEIDEQQRR
jgi:hypothetical protein